MLILLLRCGRPSSISEDGTGGVPAISPVDVPIARCRQSGDFQMGPAVRFAGAIAKNPCVDAEARLGVTEVSWCNTSSLHFLPLARYDRGESGTDAPPGDGERASMNQPSIGWSNQCERTVSHATVPDWEKGAEPGFLAGCAIAHLGGLPAEALAFKQASSDSQVLPRAPRHPITGDDRAKPAKRRRG